MRFVFWSMVSRTCGPVPAVTFRLRRLPSARLSRIEWPLECRYSKDVVFVLLDCSLVDVVGATEDPLDARNLLRRYHLEGSSVPDTAGVLVHNEVPNGCVRSALAFGVVYIEVVEILLVVVRCTRSEERRVGKECRL